MYPNRLPAASAPRFEFHGTARRTQEPEDTAAAVADEKEGFWEPIYAVPVGIAFAIPAITYEWYLVNEETQLAACFMAFTAIVYKQFGGAIFDKLEEDGKRLLSHHNALEDAIINDLQEKLHDVKLQELIVQDAEAVKALRLATYAKLNAAGKIKPTYEFKAQIERMLTMMETEEASMKEKAKQTLMELATVSVTASFSASKDLQKTSLVAAIAQLKGSANSADPVKSAYLKFFKEQAVAAASIDEKEELLVARTSMVSKLNAMASNEGYFFEFDAATGQPKAKW